MKIVTVGLNPSDVEFHEERFGREVTALPQPDTLERALSTYFEVNPYTAWFSASRRSFQQDPLAKERSYPENPSGISELATAPTSKT